MYIIEIIWQLNRVLSRYIYHLCNKYQVNIFRLAVLMGLKRNVILFLCFILHLTKTIWCRHSIKTGILLLCLCIFFALKSKWIGSDIFVFLLNNSDHGQVPLLACGAILEMMEWHWWYLILKPNFVTVFTSW